MSNAVSSNIHRRLPLLVLGGVLVCLGGCQTVQNTLKPYVCECDAKKVVEECTDRDEAGDEEARTLLAHSRQMTEAAVVRARVDAEIEGSDSDEPSYRRLERGGDEADADEEAEPKGDPLEQVDPTVESAAVDGDELDELADKYGTDLPDDDVSAFKGDFAQSEEGEELLVVEGAERISVYTRGRRLAELELDGELDKEGFEKMDAEPDQVEPRAVELVKNDTLQLLMHWREENDDGEVAYKVGVFKPIGEYVGQLFEKTLATRAEDGDELQRHGAYEVLRGDDHRFLRWIPADDDGEMLTDEAEVLEWNEWEGVYRKPEPPPTAPDDEELRSFLHPSLSS